MADEVKVTGRWVDRISKEAQSTFGKLKDGISSVNLASIALGAVSAVSLVSAFQKLQQQIHETTKAAVEQERADYALANAMRSAGSYSKELFERLTIQANAIQQVTRFSDDQVESAQALALNLGVSSKKLEDFTQAATALAVILGRDLASAMRVLARADLGSEDQLRRVIGPFKSLEEAIDRLKGKYKQVVEQSMGPYERALHDQQVEIDEAMERLGKYAVTWEVLAKKIELATLRIQEYTLAGQSVAPNPGSDIAGESAYEISMRGVNRPSPTSGQRFLFRGQPPPWALPSEDDPFMNFGGRFVGPAGPPGGSASAQAREEIKKLTEAFKRFHDDFKETMGFALHPGITSEREIPALFMDQYNQKKAFAERLQENDPSAVFETFQQVMVEMEPATEAAQRALQDFIDAEQAAALAFAYGEDRAHMFADNVVGSLQDMAIRGEFTMRSFADTILNILRDMMASAIDQATRSALTNAGRALFGAGGGGGGGGGFIDSPIGGGGSEGMGAPLLRDGIGSSSATWEVRRGRSPYSGRI